jgi:molecular chaperone GrpE
MKSKEKKSKLAQEGKIKELTSLLQHTQADFENFRKQTEKRVEEIKNRAGEQIITQILPVMDNFTLALKAKQTDSAQIIEGIKLIYGQLKSLLKENGVTPIETNNQAFNPHLHEALMKVESNSPENTIIEEFQAGYLLANKVLRAAKVKISAGPAKTNDKQQLNEKTNTEKNQNDN